MNKILFDLTATQPAHGVKRHGGGKYGEIILTLIPQHFDLTLFISS